MSDCLFVAWTEEGSVPAGGNEVNAPVAAKTVENDSVATGTVELDTVESKEDSGVVYGQQAVSPKTVERSPDADVRSGNVASEPSIPDEGTVAEMVATVAEASVSENVLRPPNDPGGTITVEEGVPILTEV
ncbi:hypothetical protein PF006_g19066 [Phytophthora fragariae]|uniref:Uncharacterized protein n=1 Tax=Phytophthora fragariae TaxID=53985 RepID=A0A6A3SHJ5_9STRA|nr:hypothetical protein PF006_g19066 [Phytophthora fragariae]